MNDVALAAVAVFAAVAPSGGVRAFAAALPVPHRRREAAMAGAFAAVLGFALFGLAAAFGDDLLGWLDVSRPSFRIAAGILMLPRAARLLWAGDTMARAEPLRSWWMAGTLPGAAPLIVAPSSLAAVVAHLDRSGAGPTLAASAIVAAIAGVTFATAPVIAERVRPTVLGAVGRGTGVLLVIVAVEMIESGVRAI